MYEEEYMYFYLNKPCYITFKNGSEKFGKVRYHEARYNNGKGGWFLELSNIEKEEIPLVLEEIADIKYN